MALSPECVVPIDRHMTIIAAEDSALRLEHNQWIAEQIMAFLDGEGCTDVHCGNPSGWGNDCRVNFKVSPECRYHEFKECDGTNSMAWIDVHQSDMPGRMAQLTLEFLQQTYIYLYRMVALDYCRGLMKRVAPPQPRWSPKMVHVFPGERRTDDPLA